ncbi:MAG: glycine cleavage system protein H [Planctomycetes bacterium]|nr:glycine cleavage system protein H [Planctomycetota bacterium]
MYDPLPVDPFMTKAAEYLLVIGFLATLLLGWPSLARRPAPVATPLPAGKGGTTPSGWFATALERFYHLGHAWARPTADGLVEIGLDDFAQKLIGKPDTIALPQAGAQLAQGRPLASLRVGGKAVDLPAPVDGVVVHRNDALHDRPGLVNGDPYGAGWLVRVRPTRWSANAEDLLQSDEAQRWMAASELSLQRRMSPSFGMLLQDGGVPVSGIARALAGEDWDRLANEFLRG